MMKISMHRAMYQGSFVHDPDPLVFVEPLLSVGLGSVVRIVKSPVDVASGRTFF
jgi:hypothetical protein